MSRNLIIASPNEEILLMIGNAKKKQRQRLLQVRKQDKEHSAQLRHKIQHQQGNDSQKITSKLKNEFLIKQSDKEMQLFEEIQRRVQSIGNAHALQNIENAGIKKDLSIEQQSKIAMRYHQAIKKVKDEQQKSSLHAKKEKTLREMLKSLEKERVHNIISQPRYLDPIENLKPVKLIGSVSNTQQSKGTRYHLGITIKSICPEVAVERAEKDELTDAKEAAQEESERMISLKQDNDRELNEKKEKAKLRHQYAKREVVMKQEYKMLLNELHQLDIEDKKRRRQTVANISKKVFQRPHLREEKEKLKQYNLEQVFERLCEMEDGDPMRKYFQKEISASHIELSIEDGAKENGTMMNTNTHQKYPSSLEAGKDRKNSQNIPMKSSLKKPMKPDGEANLSKLSKLKKRIKSQKEGHIVCSGNETAHSHFDSASANHEQNEEPQILRKQQQHHEADEVLKSMKINSVCDSNLTNDSADMKLDTSKNPLTQQNLAYNEVLLQHQRQVMELQKRHLLRTKINQKLLDVSTQLHVYLPETKTLLSSPGTDIYKSGTKTIEINRPFGTSGDTSVAENSHTQDHCESVNSQTGDMQGVSESYLMSDKIIDRSISSESMLHMTKQDSRLELTLQESLPEMLKQKTVLNKTQDLDITSRQDESENISQQVDFHIYKPEVETICAISPFISPVSNVSKSAKRSIIAVTQTNDAEDKEIAIQTSFPYDSSFSNVSQSSLESTISHHVNEKQEELRRMYPNLFEESTSKEMFCIIERMVKDEALSLSRQKTSLTTGNTKYDDENVENKESNENTLEEVVKYDSNGAKNLNYSAQTIPFKPTTQEKTLIDQKKQCLPVQDSQINIPSKQTNILPSVDVVLRELRKLQESASKNDLNLKSLPSKTLHEYKETHTSQVDQADRMFLDNHNINDTSQINEQNLFVPPTWYEKPVNDKINGITDISTYEDLGLPLISVPHESLFQSTTYRRPTDQLDNQYDFNQYESSTNEDREMESSSILPVQSSFDTHLQPQMQSISREPYCFTHLPSLEQTALEAPPLSAGFVHNTNIFISDKEKGWENVAQFKQHRIHKAVPSPDVTRHIATSKSFPEESNEEATEYPASYFRYRTDITDWKDIPVSTADRGGDKTTALYRENVLQQNKQQNQQQYPQQQHAIFRTVRVSENPQVSPIKEVDEGGTSHMKLNSLSSLQEQSLFGSTYSGHIESNGYDEDGLSLVRATKKNIHDTKNDYVFLPMKTSNAKCLSFRSSINSTLFGSHQSTESDDYFHMLEEQDTLEKCSGQRFTHSPSLIEKEQIDNHTSLLTAIRRANIKTETPTDFFLPLSKPTPHTEFQQIQNVKSFNATPYENDDHFSTQRYSTSNNLTQQPFQQLQSINGIDNVNQLHSNFTNQTSATTNKISTAINDSLTAQQGFQQLQHISPTLAREHQLTKKQSKQPDKNLASCFTSDNDRQSSSTSSVISNAFNKYRALLERVKQLPLINTKEQQMLLESYQQLEQADDNIDEGNYQDNLAGGTCHDAEKSDEENVDIGRKISVLNRNYPGEINTDVENKKDGVYLHRQITVSLLDHGTNDGVSTERSKIEHSGSKEIGELYQETTGDTELKIIYKNRNCGSNDIYANTQLNRVRTLPDNSQNDNLALRDYSLHSDDSNHNEGDSSQFHFQPLPLFLTMTGETKLDSKDHSEEESIVKREEKYSIPSEDFIKPSISLHLKNLHMNNFEEIVPQVTENIKSTILQYNEKNHEALLVKDVIEHKTIPENIYKVVPKKAVIADCGQQEDDGEFQLLSSCPSPIICSVNSTTDSPQQPETNFPAFSKQQGTCDGNKIDGGSQQKPDLVEGKGDLQINVKESASQSVLDNMYHNEVMSYFHDTTLNMPSFPKHSDNDSEINPLLSITQESFLPLPTPSSIKKREFELVNEQIGNSSDNVYCQKSFENVYQDKQQEQQTKELESESSFDQTQPNESLENFPLTEKDSNRALSLLPTSDQPISVSSSDKNTIDLISQLISSKSLSSDTESSDLFIVRKRTLKDRQLLVENERNPSNISKDDSNKQLNINLPDLKSSSEFCNELSMLSDLNLSFESDVNWTSLLSTQPHRSSSATSYETSTEHIRATPLERTTSLKDDFKSSKKVFIQNSHKRIQKTKVNKENVSCTDGLGRDVGNACISLSNQTTDVVRSLKDNVIETSGDEQRKVRLTESLTRTKRLYEKLPEVRKKTEERERIEMQKKNREKAQKFNEKLKNRTKKK